jgi:hypothetical protein
MSSKILKTELRLQERVGKSSVRSLQGLIGPSAGQVGSLWVLGNLLSHCTRLLLVAVGSFCRTGAL